MMTLNNEKQSILIVDDTAENIDVLVGILSKDYKIKIARNGLTALKIIAKQKIDLVLLDIMMPEMDGYEVCRRIKADPKTKYLPVIFITAMTDAGDEKQGLDLGAVDYITKPVNAAIVKTRVNTHLTIANQRQLCEQKVISRTRELEEAQRSAIFMLGDAGHYNDTDTGLHIWRMAAYSAALARAAGWSDKDASLLELAAPMHDMGKIGISDSILKAPRKLTDEEWIIMKTHSLIGYQILSKSKTPLFTLAAEIALNHHEKWDGSGYPTGLTENDIPESARIIAIADVFDALTMKRPYKESWPIDKALETIRESSGTHFEPRLADLFISIQDEILEIKNKWG